MNIGIVTTWFERGAAMVSRAYREALSGAHRVLIYARGGENYAVGDPLWDGDYVTWGRRVWNSRLTGIRWRDFSGWVRRNKIEVLFFNEQHFWPTVVLARRHLPDVRLGAYVDYYTSMTAPLYGLYDFLVCNTRRHQSVFAWHPHSHYVPWGTDCELFHGTYEPVAPGQVAFFHSAGMNPARKGTVIALEAFAQLPGPHRFVLHLQASLDQWPEIKRLCDADTRIKVINKTVSAPGLYHMGDVYVYPTVLEGIGLTIAEALACGLPVITTDEGPMNEFVVEGQNGWLVPPAEHRGRVDGYYWAEAYCTAEAVRAAMQRCVAQAAELRDMKKRARSYAEMHLDWRKNGGVIPSIFEEAAGIERGTEGALLERQALNGASLPLVRRAMRKGLRTARLGDGEWAQALVYG